MTTQVMMHELVNALADAVTYRQECCQQSSNRAMGRSYAEASERVFHLASALAALAQAGKVLE